MTKLSYDKPDAWIKTLQQGAEELGISLNAGQLDIMSFHGKELILWNKKFNITSITDPFEIAVKHFIDCLALASYIPDNAKVLDIGSGGGFPGFPLKVVKPLIDLVMVDASRKKISFLNHLIHSLKMTGVHAVHARCEDLAGRKGFKHSFDCVVSRAFTSLDRFIDLSLPFLSEKGVILAMKGQMSEKEVQSTQGKKLCIKIDDYTLPVGGYNRSIVKISS